jgi:hypothetical protein
MSGENVHYQFLPWLREGLAAALEGQGTSIVDGRACLDVTLTVGAKEKGTDVEADRTPAITKKVHLYGPGDVLGFDPSIVIRTDPLPNVGDFEPNFCAAIEFSLSTFPWAFTPTLSGVQLSPWISLVVLQAQPTIAAGPESAAEFTEGTLDGAGPRVPWIQVHKRSSLPNLAHAWKWAHVQVTMDGGQQPDLPSLLATEPERIVSRLICARRLRSNQKYVAFVVPTFKLGVTAAGRASQSTTDFAWNASGSDTSVDLPYYYRFEFQTGQRGDFELLVKALQPRILSDLGTRPMDCQTPGYAPEVPGISETLHLEGALQSLDTEFTRWGKDSVAPLTSLGAAFRTALATEVLNKPSERIGVVSSTVPFVAPPIYGRWATGHTSVDTGAARTIETINLDPRHRAAAGYGVEVTRRNQEALVASAWTMAGDVRLANSLLRRGQVGIEASSRIFSRLDDRPSTDVARTADLLRFTAPLHDKVLVDLSGETKTASAHLAKSRTLQSLLDPAFRRLRRRAGIVARGTPAIPPPADALDRVNDGRISLAAQPDAFAMPGLCDLTHRMIDAADFEPPPWTPPLTTSFGSVEDGDITPGIGTGGLSATEGFGSVDRADVAAGTPGTRVLSAPGLFVPVEDGDVTTGTRGTGGVPDDGDVTPSTPDTGSLSAPGLFCEPNVSCDVLRALIRENVSQLGVPGNESIGQMLCTVVRRWLTQEGPSVEPAPRLDLTTLASEVLGAIDPRKTISSRVRSRIQSEDSAVSPDLSEIPLVPEFPQPMYLPLSEISNELILPGMATVPQDTIGLLKTNRRFIEAYMCGCNHGWISEALFKELPIPQWATCMRQFWSVTDYVPNAEELACLSEKAEQKLQNRAGDPGYVPTADELQRATEEELALELRDITPVANWKYTSLGGNAPATSCKGLGPNVASGARIAAEDRVVLLIRGELLKKYPSTVIYAIDADAAGKPKLPEFSSDSATAVRKDPAFGASLSPDVTFVGFELTEDDVRGKKGKQWYFVLEERVGEARFGMDEPTAVEVPLCRWTDLTWGHVNVSPGAYLDDKSVTRTSEGCPEQPPDLDKDVDWGVSSAAMGRILLQRPNRVAVHAQLLLPPDTP